MEEKPQTEQEKPVGGKGKKETPILIAIALVGLAGIAILQFTHKDPLSREDERTLIQDQGELRNKKAPKENTNAIEKIPGNLIRENEQPESGRPFQFQMANFSQGAEYILDLGDGNKKSFKNGVLQHTYNKPGPYVVTLYARYQGQEVKLQSITKRVAQTVINSDIAPIIDY